MMAIFKGRPLNVDCFLDNRSSRRLDIGREERHVMIPFGFLRTKIVVVAGLQNDVRSVRDIR